MFNPFKRFMSECDKSKMGIKVKKETEDRRSVNYFGRGSDLRYK